MWRWILVLFAGLGLLLGFLSWKTWDRELTDRHRQNEAQRNDEMNQRVAEMQKAEQVDATETNRMHETARAFVKTLPNKAGTEQLVLTTRQFQDRHKATDGILRLDEGWELKPDRSPLTQRGIAEKGETYLTVGGSGGAYWMKTYVGEYVLILKKDRQDGAWRVDAAILPDKPR